MLSRECSRTISWGQRFRPTMKIPHVVIKAWFLSHQVQVQISARHGLRRTTSVKSPELSDLSFVYLLNEENQKTWLMALSWGWNEMCKARSSNSVHAFVTLTILAPKLPGRECGWFKKKKKIGRPSSVEWKKMRFGCAMTHWPPGNHLQLICMSEMRIMSVLSTQIIAAGISWCKRKDCFLWIECLHTI